MDGELGQRFRMLIVLAEVLNSLLNAYGVLFTIACNYSFKRSIGPYILRHRSVEDEVRGCLGLSGCKTDLMCEGQGL